MTTDTLEPRTIKDLALSLWSSAAIGLAAMGMLGLPLALGYAAWQIWAWEFTVSAFVLGLGLEVAGGFVLARLTRDDRGIGARLLAGDEAQAVLPGYVQRVAELEAQVKMGAPVVHVDRGDAKFVQPEVKDTSWQDARRLLAMVEGDYGYVPGREKSQLTQELQSNALACLARAGVLTMKGRNRYALCMTRAEAAQRLEEKVRLSI